MELYFLVARIMRRYKEIIHYNEIDLTLVEVLILGAINMNYNTPSKLVKITLQEMSYISKIISGLIEKKMIEKQQSSSDKRVCVLKLNERGINILKNINKVKEEIIIESLGIINLKERRELLLLLNKLEFILSSSLEKFENPLLKIKKEEEKIILNTMVEKILIYDYGFKS